MATQKHNIIIRPGARWDMSITFKEDNGTPIDVSGYTHYLEIRAVKGGKILATPTVDDGAAADGVVEFSLPPADTLLISARTGVYDILQKEDAFPTNVFYVFGGDVKIEPCVTEIVAP